jgi:cell division protein FtsB
MEKLKEVKREIREEIKGLRKENQEVKREIEQLREEFKNKEKMDTLAAHRCGLTSSGQTGWG